LICSRNVHRNMAMPVSDVARISRACTAIVRWPTLRLEIIGLALTFFVFPR
jgi:hypothetical protein